MRFKLIVAFVEEALTENVMQAAREAGATGSTLISNARGEGLKPKRSFFGLELESQRDVILFLVEEHLSRHILETIEEVAHLDASPGAGIALQLDVEDAVGISHQIRALTPRVKEEI